MTPKRWGTGSGGFGLRTDLESSGGDVVGPWGVAQVAVDEDVE